MSNIGLDSVDFTSLPAELGFSITSEGSTKSSRSPQSQLADASSLCSVSTPRTSLSTVSDEVGEIVDSPSCAAPRYMTQHICPVTPQYSCTISGCTKRFVLSRHLKNHLTTHVRKMHRCNQCPAKYPHAKSLREHRQTKHENIRYKCDVQGCNEWVAQKKNLARHKQLKHAASSI